MSAQIINLTAAPGSVLRFGERCLEFLDALASNVELYRYLVVGLGLGALAVLLFVCAIPFLLVFPPLP